MIWNDVLLEPQIDLTSYCNAACLACGRHSSGAETLHKHLVQQHFDVELWNRLCEYDFNELGVQSLMFNGNWGDACMHPNLIEMIETYYKFNEYKTIKISTNGSLRTKKWWAELGKMLGDKSHVIFCIDGTDDETHAHYRQKTIYSKIIENMIAFNNAGGKSLWMMTAFDHNQHQIATAHRLAEKYGCAMFKVRKSNTNNMSLPGRTGQVTANEPVPEEYKKRKKMAEFYYPETETYIEKHLPERLKSPCKFYKESQVQIDPYGSVWPCCWTSLYRWGEDKHGNPVPTPEFRDKTLAERFNLSNKSLKQILSDDWYNKKLAQAIDTGGWKICNEICVNTTKENKEKK